MKIPPVSTFLGVAAMLVGGCWILFAFLQPLTKLITEEKELREYLFFFIALPIFALPGMFAAYFGFRLTKEKAPRNYKGLIGVFAVFAVLWLAPQLEHGLAAHVHEELKNSLSLFLALIVVIPTYVFLTTWLMRRDGIKVNGVGSVIGKGATFIVALQIWQLGMDLFDVYAPIEPGYTHIRKAPWEFLSFAIPLASAYLFYKITLWRLAKSAAEPSHGSHPQSRNELSGSAPA